MVGVVVAMVISTMHEKSCIDLHNARKFEKSSKIQSFTHLAITMMKLWKYHSHGFIKLSKLYNAIIQKVMSHKIEQEFLFEFKNYRHIIYKTDSQNYVPFKNICVHNFCRFSDTGIIMTSQRHCYARDLQNHA